MPTRKFQELLDEMPAARRKKIAKRVEKALAAMPLEEVRRARQMTQVALAQTLGVNQGEVSKIEHRTDVYLSTLAGYVEALGDDVTGDPAPAFRIARCESASLRDSPSRRSHQLGPASPGDRDNPGSRPATTSPSFGTDVGILQFHLRVQVERHHTGTIEVEAQREIVLHEIVVVVPGPENRFRRGHRSNRRQRRP